MWQAPGFNKNIFFDLIKADADIEAKDDVSF